MTDDKTMAMGVISKNLEMSENENKQSVIGEVSGFRVSEII